jgi:MFS family permease
MYYNITRLRLMLRRAPGGAPPSRGPAPRGHVPRRSSRAGLGLSHQLWIVQAGIFLNALGWGAVLPFEIIYLHNGRGFSLGVAGSVIGVVTGLAVVASPAAGPVIDRAGARATAAGGGIALAAGYAGLAAASRPWQAFAAAAAAGIGNGALQPSQSALLAALAPAQLRHRVIAVSRVATNVGFGLGGGLGGLVAALGLRGLVALFLGNAATYLLYVAVLVWAVAKEPPAEPMPGGYRSVLRDGRFVWLAGINVAIITVGWGYFSWVVPQYAHADLAISPAHIGLLLLADAFTVAIAQIPVSRVLEGHRRTTAIAISGVIFTGSFLLIAAASWTRAGPAYAALLIAAIACGIGECFHTTALMPLVADMAPAALRGRYMAAMSLSWWIGLALAPTAGTRLLAVSPAAALLPAAGLALAASVAALALERRLPAAISRTPRPSVTSSPPSSPDAARGNIPKTKSAKCPGPGLATDRQAEQKEAFHHPPRSGA